MSPSVVVIGGGITGLVAARRLVQRGAEVTVVEADHRLGGKLHTSAFAGRMVDEGADAFLLRVPWAIELCRDLGIDDELVNPASRTAYVWSRGALRPMPRQVMGVPTDLDDLAATGILSPAGLARVAEDLTLPAETPADDETIGAMVERRLGREALERLVDPLVGGINAGDTRELSLAAVVPQLDAAARDPEHPSLIEACRAQQARGAASAGDAVFATPAAGMGRLVSAVAAEVADATLVLGRRVEAIEPGPGGAGHRVHLDDGTSLDADAVVLTVPAHVAAPLLTTVSPEAARTLGGIEHTSVVMLTIAVRPEDVAHALDASGFLVPRVEGTTLTACSWASSKWAHLGPAAGDGTLVLRASVGRHGDQAALDLDDDALVERVLADLDTTMGLHGAPTEVRVGRWNASLPQYRPGHLDRIDEMEAALPSSVAIAGMALRGVGVPACIHSGEVAADRIMDGIGAAPA